MSTVHLCRRTLSLDDYWLLITGLVSFASSVSISTSRFFLCHGFLKARLVLSESLTVDWCMFCEGWRSLTHVAGGTSSWRLLSDVCCRWIWYADHIPHDPRGLCPGVCYIIIVLFSWFRFIKKTWNLKKFVCRAYLPFCCHLFSVCILLWSCMFCARIRW